jgi:hypothetical protein
MKNERLREALIKRLSDVFPQLPPIPVSEVTDCSDDRGGDQLRTDFGGIPWWEITEEVLQKNLDSLPLLSPKGFWYYYPAYLRFGLERFCYENAVLEFSVYTLFSSDESWYKERFQFFSALQIDFLRDFLRCVAAETSLDLTSEAKKGLHSLSLL